MRRRRRALLIGRVSIVLGVVALLLAVATFAWPHRDHLAEATGLTNADLSRIVVSVTDGDTVRIRGRATRLVGYNAPETRGAECSRERELGERATQRLRELVSAGNLRFEPVACSCRPGTEGTSACNYGRACGRLYSSGRDVGAILISEGLAVPFMCGSTRCPPTPRPWC